MAINWTDAQIEEIVASVMKGLTGEAPKAKPQYCGAGYNGKKYIGVYEDMNDAIDAAEAGYRAIRAMSLEEREKVINIIRDLCRKLSGSFRLSIIDERNEIASTVGSTACNDVGTMSDVFNSYNKYDGIMTAVKVMSPMILVCDEIGSKEDMKALEYAVNSGVRLIATTHAADYDEAKRKSGISKLIKDKVFDYACVLGTGALCGKLLKLVKITDD